MHSTPLAINKLIESEPDLVDRIFDYILSDPALAKAMLAMQSRHADPVGELKSAVRAEFSGERVSISSRTSIARQVLALFDGRNASEVARRLNISRATVYRHIKQPGKPSSSKKTVSNPVEMRQPRG